MEFGTVKILRFWNQKARKAMLHQSSDQVTKHPALSGLTDIYKTFLIRIGKIDSRIISVHYNFGLVSEGRQQSNSLHEDFK